MTALTCSRVYAITWYRGLCVHAETSSRGLASGWVGHPILLAGSRRAATPDPWQHRPQRGMTL
eukprot:3161123-Heterocapsa_arctica.AAC.1